MIWSILACHWSASLTPFKVVSSSARFMCLASFSYQSQQASSMMAPLASRATSMASEQASTKTVNSFPSSLWIIRVTLAMVSVSMLLRVASRTSLSHPDDTEVACCFIAAIPTLSQPHMGKLPTSFPHTEKMLGRVMTGGTSGMSLPLLQRSLSLHCC